MNLPNYFLADLPPEAHLSAQMITDACQTLKRNREQFKCIFSYFKYFSGVYMTP